MAQVFKGSNAWRPKSEMIRPKNLKAGSKATRPTGPKGSQKNLIYNTYCASYTNLEILRPSLTLVCSMWSGCAFKKWLLLVLSSTSFNLMYAEYQNGTVLEIQQCTLVVLVLLQRIELTFLLNSIPWLRSMYQTFIPVFFLTYVLLVLRSKPSESQDVLFFGFLNQTALHFLLLKYTLVYDLLDSIFLCIFLSFTVYARIRAMCIVCSKA